METNDQQPTPTPLPGEPQAPPAASPHPPVTPIPRAATSPAASVGGPRPQASDAGREPAPAGPAPIPGAVPPSWNSTPPPPTGRRMNGCLLALLIALGAIALLGIVVVMVAGMMGGREEGVLSVGGSGDKIAVIPINGVIQMGGEESGLFGGATFSAAAAMQQIRSAAKDKTVKAVILRINSPGGSAAASQCVYEEVMKLREKTKKPVIASMGDIAASGGYYIACSANTIFASPATMTGSIGVIMQSMNFSGLAQKYGVKDETVTSGPFKDMFSPLRPTRDDERRVAREMINEVYGQFVADVCKGRNMKPEVLRRLADGRVYTGSQALRVGLIDRLGNFHDAVDEAARQAKIKGEPQLKEYGRPRGLAGLLSELVGLQPARAVAPLPLPALGPGLWMIWQEGALPEAK